MERRADAELQDIGVRLSVQHEALVARLTDAMAERIPELPHDPALVDLLAGSTGSNLETLAHVLRGRVPIADVHAPPAAVEYARRLAQRGTTPTALLRAYRVGQQLVLEWTNELVAARVGDREIPLATALEAMHEFTDISFRYIDSVSEEVAIAYQEERDRWLANRGAVRRAMVDGLLRGERLDIGAAEAALGHRLRQHHLGVVAWVNGTDAAADLSGAERLLTAIAQRLGVGAPLVVPRDRATAWAWLGIGRSDEVDLAVVQEVLRDAGGEVRIALGGVAPGETGFRSTHEEAVAAQRVAEVGQCPPGQLTAFSDPEVRAAALLVRDLPATRRLVRRALGDLAGDDEASGRLRETLLAFVDARESYVATAARVHLHKNTIKYRVDRAIEARGKPLAEDRLDLELALIACKRLGPEVLHA